ncbi:zinc-finger domain-containing protein [Paraphysoderma sedebokerense]|nr:zinc-finger domain-containing protein [Paraphysoderma sedebokerense]
MTGPRFEQVDMEAQPNPPSAMELIAQQPVRKVHGRVAVCDGGGGALGHPKVYINLDQPGAHDCGYCGLRFEQEHHH